ncbi:site-2 protease family protein [Clostridium sediminicola]|uniref:site-2 protease family protein n=1 Tax=Clostridium sediminicola TaxID=3114879 RepID=UPI0031F20A9C
MELLDIIYLLPGILLGFTFHELAHAQTAVWLGDDTPRYQGRLSANPFVHIDIWGLLLIIVAGFGWAKPVQINPNNFKNKRRDDILVSLAGPIMNLFIAFVFLIIMKICYFIPTSILNDNLYYVLMNIFKNAVWINVVLFIFNLLPIPPLDGSHIFSDIFKLNEKNFHPNLYTMSKFLLPVLIITNLIDYIIVPPVSTVYNYLIGVFF